MNPLSRQSMPILVRICINLVQFTRSNAFCQSTKQKHSSSSISKVRSATTLIIPIASLDTNEEVITYILPIFYKNFFYKFGILKQENAGILHGGQCGCNICRPVSVNKPLVVLSLNSAEEFFANRCPAKVMLAKISTVTIILYLRELPTALFVFLGRYKVLIIAQL